MKIRSMTTYSVYVAIFLMMATIPQLGFIQIPPVKATLITIPVALVTIHKGWKGAIFGCIAFGTSSLISAAMYGSVFLILGWGQAFIILFIGRLLILFPLLLMLLIIRFIKIPKPIKGFFIGVCISVSNTLIVVALAIALNYSSKTYWGFLLLISTNIAIEWTVPPFISASIATFGFYLKEKDFFVGKDRY